MIKYRDYFLVLVASLFCHSTVFAKKNVLFIVADDIGWADFGFYNSLVSTPNIDNLVSNGVLLNQSYAYSLCTPSRNSIMTGYFAEHTGLQHDVLGPTDDFGIPLDYKLLPEYFQDYGYNTHAVGKWHLGYCNTSYTPAYRGFDTFYGFFNSHQDYYDHNLTAANQNGFDLWYQEGSSMSIISDQNGTHSLDTFTNRAVEILESHDTSNPFFIYFAPQNAHDPLEVPDDYYNEYSFVKNTDRRTYLGLITQLDDAIGTLVDKLDELGMLEDTIIAFTVDNGGTCSVGARNYPLRGCKSTVYEGGHRVRSFIYNSNLEADVNEGLFHAVDWLPTLLNGALDETITLSSIDGMNHWSEIYTQTSTTRESFIYLIDPYGEGETPYISTQAVRYGNYKLILGCPGLYNSWYKCLDSASKFGVTKSYDYCNSASNSSSTRTGVTYLFDLSTDPYETTNLSSNTTLLSIMYTVLSSYNSTTVTPLNNPNSTVNTAAFPSKWNGAWSPGWC